MAVRLSTSAARPVCINRWIAVAGSRPTLDPAAALPGLAARLEAAFDAVAADWMSQARALATGSGAGLSHTVAAAANVSDFGLMLAWAHLVGQLAAEPDDTLVVCDDPWLFRHLATLPGVIAGKPPALWHREWLLALRGWLARAKAAVTLLRAWRALRRQRGQFPKGTASLLVYGHPASTVDGSDGYFGPLLREAPELRRMLHVDCPPARAVELAADGRTASLHAWGSPLDAFAAMFARWRPRSSDWLVRRAAALEGGTGQPALIHWQRACQARWLTETGPRLVAWPWENHAWERAFVPAARAIGAFTVGYQHSVIGRHMLNYRPQSNRDWDGELPDRILTSGMATRDQLAAFGIAPDRLAVGGALRFSGGRTATFAPDGPVLLALPAARAVCEEMVAAARCLALPVAVRDHPMTPFAFVETATMTRAAGPLESLPGVRAVVFAATTVGQQAMLDGLPVLRFLCSKVVALDILPAGLSAPVADADGLAGALAGLAPSLPIARETYFAPVDWGIWKACLQ